MTITIDKDIASGLDTVSYNNLIAIKPKRIFTRDLVLKLRIDENTMYRTPSFSFLIINLNSHTIYLIDGLESINLSFAKITNIDENDIDKTLRNLRNTIDVIPLKREYIESINFKSISIDCNNNRTIMDVTVVSYNTNKGE